MSTASATSPGVLLGRPWAEQEAVSVCKATQATVVACQDVLAWSGMHLVPELVMQDLDHALSCHAVAGVP